MSYRKRTFDGGFQGQRGYKRPQRFHSNKFSQLPVIEKTTINVCRDINKIGEDCSFSDLEKNLNHISNPIAVEFNKEESFKKGVLATIYATLIEQPHKALLLSCLVQIANAKNQSIGKYVVEYFHQKVTELLASAANGESPRDYSEKHSNDSGVWNKIKLVMRFFAVLSPIISKGSLLQLFGQHLDLAIELQTDNRVLAELIYYNSLVSLPCLLIFNPEDLEVKNGIEELLEKALQFELSEEKSDLIVPIEGLESQQLIVNLLSSLKQSVAENFRVEKIFPKFDSWLLQENSPELQINNLPQVPYPELSVLKSLKLHGKIDGLHNHRSLILDIFDRGEFETKPKIDSYEYIFFRDIVYDIVEALEYNKKTASEQLANLSFYFKAGLFVGYNKSLNELNLIHELNRVNEIKQSTWTMEDIIVENILSLIFRLPRAETLTIYYFSLLIDICEKAPVGMAPRFGKAMRFLYNNICSLDVELRLRFIDWMSMQLSNFQFRWKWNEWKDDSVKYYQSQYHPKKLFLANLIFKEIRLSNKERILESFGLAEFNKYLNISLLGDLEQLNLYDKQLFGEDIALIETFDFEKSVDQPDLKFIQNDAMPLYQESQEFLKLLQVGGGTESQFWDLFKHLDAKIADRDNKTELKVNFVMQIVCFSSSRSISHFETLVSKLGYRIKKLLGKKVDVAEIAKTEDGFDYEGFYVGEGQENVDRYVIQAVLRYWNDTPQNGFFIVEILNKLGLVGKRSTVEFLIDYRSLVLRNSLATELYFKLIDHIVRDNDSVAETLTSNFQLLVAVLNLVVDGLPGIEVIVAQEDDEKIGEPEYENKWKYRGIMGLLKAVVRKYGPQYKALEVGAIVGTIGHADSKKKVEEMLALA